MVAYILTLTGVKYILTFLCRKELNGQIEIENRYVNHNFLKNVAKYTDSFEGKNAYILSIEKVM